MPISHPANWSKQLCSELGRFYTHNIPEDAQAFNHGVLTAREFWDQMMFAYEERSRALDYLLNHQDEDFLFVYFGTVDQGCHMLWHFMDREHPGYVQDEVLKDGIAKLYEMLDGRLGRVRSRIGKGHRADRDVRPRVRSVLLGSELEHVAARAGLHYSQRSFQAGIRRILFER